MIYRSNIEAPDLAPQFAATTICQVRPWSLGHDVLSDAEYEPNCGFMTHDEVALLFECARRTGGEWVDIGARFGWTSAHISEAGAFALCVDPHFVVPQLASRFDKNVMDRPRYIETFYGTSAEFFDASDKCKRFDGICIDGNHDDPEPLNDARNALAHLKETGVIILHDFWGRPVRDAADFLIDSGLNCRVYDTPNGMAACWRGDFDPPEHVADPRIDWDHVRINRAGDFDFGRTV